ncbi:MAG: hypothetical protein WEE67_05050 [Chloroflexota bacterium]
METDAVETEMEEIPAAQAPDRFALVWIDAEGARILRWREKVTEARVASEIPVHERSTFHVRHDPLVRHGGGGSGADDAARHRTEHVRQFLSRVEDAILAEEALEVLGTGELCQRLASQVRRHDRTHHRDRSVIVDHSMRLTRPQLVARLMERVGLEPVRGGVGAYRWTGDLPHERSGRVTGPRRVVRKPPR